MGDNIKNVSKGQTREKNEQIPPPQASLIIQLGVNDKQSVKISFSELPVKLKYPAHALLHIPELIKSQISCYVWKMEYL